MPDEHEILAVTVLQRRIRAMYVLNTRVLQKCQRLAKAHDAAATALTANGTHVSAAEAIGKAKAYRDISQFIKKRL